MNQISKSTRKDPRPKGFVATLIITGIMVYRIAVVFMWGTLGNGTPEVWVIPYAGDAFVGVTALIVTYLLWKRRGPIVWMTGIAFHVIGIKDFSVAGQLIFLDPMPSMPDPTFGMIFMSIGISLQLLCIALLIRNRDYYLELPQFIKK